MKELAQILTDSRNPYDVIDSAKDKFLTIIQEDDTGVDWEKESAFAYQAIVKNDYALSIAMKNRTSLYMAMVNVASVGLSLNPATSYAYLVPRDGVICLDISYLGLIKIATDSGSIKWAKAEMIYGGDEFIYKGPAELPEIRLDPFGKDRRTEENFKGVVCIAKTLDGDFLIEAMDAEEIYKIRDEASSVKNAKSEAKKLAGPWFRYFGEMAKKACIKRASKTWPKTEQHERIQKAVEVINETEGSEWAEETHRFKPGEKVEIIEQMRTALTNGDDMGVAELVEEYTQGDPEESMKFFALFSPVERSCIKALTDASVVENERIKMGKPELNEPLETSEL